jgi:DNA-binding response OmpR family regulator
VIFPHTGAGDVLRLSRGDGRRRRTHARAYPGVPLDRTVDVRVRRLCETIDTRASKRSFIQTRYGVYSLEPVEK